MEPSGAVNDPPCTGWQDSRPEGLHTQLWASARPTDATLAGLSLPAGTATYSTDGNLLAWKSTPEVHHDLGELWLRCARAFPDTGLWPLCESNWVRDGTRFPTERRWKQPWSDPYAVPTDVYDAATLPDRHDYLIDEDGPDALRRLLEDLELKDTSMILAEPVPYPADPLSHLFVPDGGKRLIRAEWPEEPGELTLVACRRPSDSVLMCDFGVANDGATPGIFTGVLRSWETRFGVVPIMLTPAWTSFQVIAPPVAEPEIERLATEVVCFAMDTAVQGGFNIPETDHDASPQQLAQAREWQIWWD